jgi:hypothetical protein
MMQTRVWVGGQHAARVHASALRGKPRIACVMRAVEFLESRV